MRLAGEHDVVAGGVNDIVVRRLFSAVLALEAALGLMGQNRAAGRIKLAVSELDQATGISGTWCLDHRLA